MNLVRFVTLVLPSTLFYWCEELIDAKFVISQGGAVNIAQLVNEYGYSSTAKFGREANEHGDLIWNMVLTRVMPI